MNRSIVTSRVGSLAALLAAGVCLVPLSVCSASAFSALNIDFLGRGGGSYGMVARPGDADNVVWNASGLGLGNGRVGFGGYMDYLVQVKGGIAGYSGSTGNNMGYGLFLSYLSSGTVTRTGWDDPTGGRGDEFSHGEIVFGISGGARITPYLTTGAGLKLARESTDDAVAGGLFGDLSGTVRIHPFTDGDTGAGYHAYSALVLRNVEIARWQDKGGEAPTGAEMGLAIESPQDTWVGGFSFYSGKENRREVRLGFTARPSKEFELRLGYRRRIGAMSDRANDMPWQRGLSAGFGVGFGKVWVDYTYEDASPLDNIHRFALRAAVGP